jgi:hypothetical protein
LEVGTGDLVAEFAFQAVEERLAGHWRKVESRVGRKLNVKGKTAGPLS